MRLNLDLPDTNRDESPGNASAEEPMDENLHYGRAWHRYRYCFRASNPLRLLDVGCGTGLSTLALARLNPGVTVRGVDASAAAVGLAADRHGAPGPGDLEFASHDPTDPFPKTWGAYDFVVCRGLLGRTGEPDRVLANLSRILDPNGLLLATFPSCHGRMGARLLRQAVDALTAPDAGLEERARIGLNVMTALRPEHPVRSALAQAAAASPTDPHSALHRFVLDALTATNEWTLEGATRALERAGLRLLYAATPWRWLPDRSFAPERLFGVLREAIETLPPEPLTALVDALDPHALGDCYSLYACPESHAPSLPSWPHTRHEDPDGFDALIPHLTGLAWPDTTLPRSASSLGRTLYRTVSGALGELDRISVLRLGAVDGGTSCGFIDRKLSSRMRASDSPSARQECWINLADCGFISLQSPRAH